MPGMPKGFVGHKIRFQDRTGPDTVLKVMTDGILLAETHSDRELRAYDTIIVDEAHERSLNIDFLLGYLKRLVALRPELKVIVTSATIDTQRFSDFFGGAPVIEVSGRTYPGGSPLSPRVLRGGGRGRRAGGHERGHREGGRRDRGPWPHGRHPRIPPGRARDPRGGRDASQAPPEGRGDPAALLAPVGRGAGPRLRALGRAAHRARDERRGNLAHGARHPLRDRHGTCARQAFQPAAEDRPVANRARLAGRGDAARRALRPRGERRGDPPLCRGGLRGEARLHHARDPADLARERDPAHGRPRAGRDRGLSLSRAAHGAPDRGRLPQPLRAGRHRRETFAHAARSRTLEAAGGSADRPDASRFARIQLPVRDGDPRRRALDTGPARPAPGEAPGIGPRPRGVPRRSLRFRPAPEPVEVLRRGLSPQGIQPQALGRLPRAFPLLRAHARVARPGRAASRDGGGTQDPRERDGRHLRAGAPRASDRARLERRPQVPGGRTLQRPARHSLRHLAGVGAEEEPPALGNGRGAAGDHARLRAKRRSHRSRVDRKCRSAPGHAHALGAPLGPRARRSARLRVGGALRARDRGEAQGELRPAGSGSLARGVHRGRAGGGRVRHEARVLRSQPRARSRGGGPRAPGAAPGRARRRSRHLRVLRHADPGGRARCALLRGLVRGGGPGGREASLPREGRPHAPRRGERDGGALPEAASYRRARLRARLPLRARTPHGRRHDERAAGAPEPAGRGRHRLAGARHGEGQGRLDHEVAAQARARVARAGAGARDQVPRAREAGRQVPRRRGARLRLPARGRAARHRPPAEGGSARAPHDEPARRGRREARACHGPRSRGTSAPTRRGRAADARPVEAGPGARGHHGLGLRRPSGRGRASGARTRRSRATRRSWTKARAWPFASSTRRTRPAMPIARA